MEKTKVDFHELLEDGKMFVFKGGKCSVNNRYYFPKITINAEWGIIRLCNSDFCCGVGKSLEDNFVPEKHDCRVWQMKYDEHMSFDRGRNYLINLKDIIMDNEINQVLLQASAFHRLDLYGGFSPRFFTPMPLIHRFFGYIDVILKKEKADKYKNHHDILINFSECGQPEMNMAIHHISDIHYFNMDERGEDLVMDFPFAVMWLSFFDIDGRCYCENEIADDLLKDFLIQRKKLYQDLKELEKKQIAHLDGKIKEGKEARLVSRSMCECYSDGTPPVVEDWYIIKENGKVFDLFIANGRGGQYVLTPAHDYCNKHKWATDLDEYYKSIVKMKAAEEDRRKAKE